MTGWLHAASGFVVLSYYTVVGGWVLHYVGLSCLNSFGGLPAEEIGGLFGQLTASATTQIFWHAVFMLTTILVVVRRVSGGLEQSNKIMLPLLFFMLCGLVIYAL